MFNPDSFIKFKTEYEHHVETQAKQAQKHKELIEGIRSSCNFTKQPAIIARRIDQLEKNAVDLSSSCAQVTIAINLESEFKRQLFPKATPRSQQRSQSSMMSLKEMKRTDTKLSELIHKEWFGSEAGEDNFFDAIHLLKSVSAAVHPVNTIQGTPLTVSTALALLQQDFEPAESSIAADRGLVWDTQKKDAISRLVEKLGTVRESLGETQLFTP
ncbi:hypothetical protein H4Q26_016218 [Puccinia striiformis f. sp. tritici PST-130]|nr:hypothetical protein H4Q26_016218 [Puccinia striiformis f. sp. tritici PST-130]